MKLAETWTGKLNKYAAYPPVPDRASQSDVQLLKQFEDAENMLSDVAFNLKFKKDKQGKPLTPMMAKDVSKIIREIKVVLAEAEFVLK